MNRTRFIESISGVLPHLALALASVVAALLFILNAWFNYKFFIYLFI